MNRDMKAILGVTLLVLGLMQGANMFVNEERTMAGWLWTLLLLGGAVLFWLWIMRDQRSAEEAAEETLDEAEKQLEVAEQEVIASGETTGQSAEKAEPVAQAETAEPAAPPPPAPQSVNIDVEEEAEPAAPPAPEPVTEVQTTPTVSAEPDDLTRINGIGPSYRDILVNAGVDTYAKLATMSEDEIVKLVRDNGGRKSATMSTWVEQAKLAAAGDWDGLAKLQSSP